MAGDGLADRVPGAPKSRLPVVIARHIILVRPERREDVGIVEEEADFVEKRLQTSP